MTKKFWGFVYFLVFKKIISCWDQHITGFQWSDENHGKYYLLKYLTFYFIIIQTWLITNDEKSQCLYIRSNVSFPIIAIKLNRNRKMHHLLYWMLKSIICYVNLFDPTSHGDVTQNIFNTYLSLNPVVLNVTKSDGKYKSMEKSLKTP